jgi:transcriptional regulator of NAD metabolism
MNPSACSKTLLLTNRSYVRAEHELAESQLKAENNLVERKLKAKERAQYLRLLEMLQNGTISHQMYFQLIPNGLTLLYCCIFLTENTITF